MTRNKSKELFELSSSLGRQALHFDEDRIKEGDVVKWETWPISARVKKDVLSGSYSVGLTENAESSTLRSVIIKELDADAIVLKPDHFGIRHFVGNTWNKACDYVIFTKRNAIKYALFIELKTLLYDNLKDDCVFSFSHDEDKKIAWQFLGANAAIDNIIHNLVRKNLKKHMPSEDCLAEFAKSVLYEYKRRYIVLYKKIVCPSGSTGTASTTNPANEYIEMPNVKSLESPIHAMPVDSGKCYSIGDLFSVACLED